MDCHQYVSHNNAKSAKFIEKMKNELNLIDPWRICNPESKRYTWSRRNPIKQARLDFFLISEELLSIVHNVRILPGYRTDHSIIELELKLSENARGRGVWRFNNSLLRDHDYIKLVKDIINVNQRSTFLQLSRCTLFLTECLYAFKSQMHPTSKTDDG